MQHQTMIDETTVNILISDEVIAGIATSAAKEIKDVAEVSNKLTSADIKNLLGGKNTLKKGVSVEVTGSNAEITIMLVVKYGCKIPDVAYAVQAAIKSAVENMTSLNVTAVNIKVVGIAVAKAVKTVKKS